MKPKHIASLALLSLLLPAANLPAQNADSSLVVHEWGTFTSFQGADGVLLDWRPLQSSALPKFVYDWSKPGLDRKYVGNFVSKNLLITRQRMETPVIYFYSDHDETVDVTVKFPQGRITEWYPQADQVGPSLPATSIATNSETMADATVLHSYASESMIHWSNLLVLPKDNFVSAHQSLPRDASGSHYFAARETDSDFIIADAGHVQSLSLDAIAVGCGTPPQVMRQQARSSALTMAPSPGTMLVRATGPETEKFLFYRGAGSFATPLLVTMPSDDAVILANTSDETLSNLFIVGIKEQEGSFIYVANLPAGAKKTVSLKPLKSTVSSDSLARQIGERMSDALQKSGLFEREADAMVSTWKDSWFQENGLRVLYILPRPWTDRTLPMTLNPAPKSLARVMVGRAEIFSPGAKQNLALQLKDAQTGDPAASAQARETLKDLGRFAEPAFFQAFAAAKLPAGEQAKLFALVNDPRKPN